MNSSLVFIERSIKLYHFGHIVKKGCIYWFLSPCIILIPTSCWELRGQPSVQLKIFVHFISFSKAAKLADCQSDASEVAQIYVISFFSPGCAWAASLRSLAFSIATSSVGTPCTWSRSPVLSQTSLAATESSTSHKLMWCSMATRLTEDWHSTF